MATALITAGTTLPTAVPCAPLLSMERRSALASELNRLPTPSIAENFQTALLETGVTERYPTLVHDIRHGSPLGNPAPLTENHIFKNLEYAYLAEEITLGRISGPFTIDEAEFMFELFQNDAARTCRKKR
jgi:hypothetical protein